MEEEEEEFSGGEGRGEENVVAAAAAAVGRQVWRQGQSSWVCETRLTTRKSSSEE